MGRTTRSVNYQAPTLEDVAREAGVSRALVSLVMRQSPKVSDARRKLVLDAAARLGYRPNANARSLASRQTRVLGAVLHELHNPFYVEIHDGIAQGAADRGYRVLIGTSEPRRGEQSALETLLELRVDGLILVGSRLPTPAILAVAETTPTVVVARDIRSPLVDSIKADERAGARHVVQHLVDLGHRHITHVDGGAGAGASSRRAGYRLAMREHGLHASIVPGDYTDRAGAVAAEKLLASRRRPTAVFAANDFVAAGLMSSLAEAGLRVPDDLSVVGYDNTYLAALHHVSLTTVNQPRPAMGARAVEFLMERIDGRTSPRRERMTPTLVIRGSTAPP
jgi:DNA-binding LacI/PurR family transcriptional regulator